MPPPRDAPVDDIPAPTGAGSWWLAVGIPCLTAALILAIAALADTPTATVGVLTAVPLLAAVFGSPLQTATTSAIVWLSASLYERAADDGSAAAQTARLGILVVAGIIAVVAATYRVRRELHLFEAQRAQAERAADDRRATHDELTGLLNRRGLAEAIADLADSSVTLVLIDCDRGTRGVAERSGPVGDEFLVGLAGRLRSNVSRRDVVGRWVGDAFLVAIRAPFPVGSIVAERLRNAVSERPMQTSAGLLPVSLHLGIAEWPPGQPIEAALATADRDLAAAKAHVADGPVRR